MDWDTPITLDAGPHTASEDTLAGYAASDWFNACATDGTVNLNPGDNLTCEITNDDIAPTLTMVKHLPNDNGGTATQDEFEVFIDGFAKAWDVAYELTAGVEYVVSETEKDGYEASGWYDDCAANGTVTLALGETATCTITNDDIAPTLTVIKYILPADDLGKFNLLIDGTPYAENVGNGGTTGAVELLANQLHTVSETAGTEEDGTITDLADYVTEIGGDCAADGSITLGLAENKTCTITNKRVYVEIVKKISKDYDPLTMEGSWHNFVEVVVGTPLYYTFTVTNTGGVGLETVVVTDPTLGELLYGNPDHEFCIIENLPVGESAACVTDPLAPEPFGPTSALFTGENEFNENTATAEGCTQGVCDSAEDTVRYIALHWAFTPGFWKNHGPSAPSGNDAWGYTAYETTGLLCDTFANANIYYDCNNTPFPTFLWGLNLRGGKDELGASEILLRAAVASLLDASFHEVNHGDVKVGSIVYFPLYSSYEVCMSYGHGDAFCAENNVAGLVDAALDPDGEEPDMHRIRMLELAARLDEYNNGFEWINWDEDGPLP